MFGDIFDFNRDGDTDAFEMALDLSIVMGEESEHNGDGFFDDAEDDETRRTIMRPAKAWKLN